MLLTHALPFYPRLHEETAPSQVAQAQQGPLRLAYLVSRYPAISHTFILREVSELRRLGAEIAVASINTPDRNAAAMTANERAEAGQTYYVKRHGLLGALAAHLWGLRRPLAYARGWWQSLRLGGANLRQILYGAFYFTEALMLARWMQAQQLQHLHVHFASAAANVGLALKQFAPITLSFTVHGPDEFYDAPGQHLREKIAAADYIVCISHYARSQLMHLSPATQWHKFEICPLGVDAHDYSSRREAGTSHSPFNILCVGRLTPAKGQRILIDACRKLRDGGRDFRLTLVGNGPDEAALREHVSALGMSGQIEFTGALNQDEVRARYAQADAFALASFAEGVPVVLMEAMASGVPCVATRITGIPELIRHEHDGLLVAPSSVDELAAALARLMDEPRFAQSLADNALERVVRKHHLKRNVARLSEIFQQHSGGQS